MLSALPINQWCGLAKVTVPGGAGFWIDDIIARRYANPEPTVALGVEVTAP